MFVLVANASCAACGTRLGSWLKTPDPGGSPLRFDLDPTMRTDVEFRAAVAD